METGSLNSIGIAMYISYLHETHRNIAFFRISMRMCTHFFFLFLFLITENVRVLSVKLMLTFI